MAQQETHRSWTWVWVVLALVVVSVVLYLRTGQKRVTVHTTEVQRADITTTVSTNGKVVPLQDYQAHTAAGGEVKNLYVSLGQRVASGQELVRMDDAEARKNVTAAEASLASAKAALDAMQRGGTQDERLTASADLDAALSQQKLALASLASLQKLQAQGAASTNEVANAQQRVSDANAKISQLQTRRTGRYGSEDLAAQRAQVAQAQATLAAARNSMGSVDIRAPFSGTVYAIPISQYDFVQSGEALLDVADLTKLQVLAYFDEPEIGNLADGQPVKIVWDAKPNMVWHGHIVEAPTTIIQYGSTRNVGECLITVDDARGDLLPNTNVTVTVTTKQHTDVLSLPREALHTEGTSNYVFRIVNEKLLRTPVGVGALNLTRVEITSGLGSGDKVALSATTEEELSDGLRVKARN